MRCSCEKFDRFDESAEHVRFHEELRVAYRQQAEEREQSRLRDAAYFRQHGKMPWSDMLDM